MDTLILGLLQLKELTVYEIQLFLRQGMYLLYSDSMGSIQAAIKKLLREKYVVFVEVFENGKMKKIYSITDTGKEYFSHWLSQPIEPETAQNRILTKLFFMGLLPYEEREAFIRNYIYILEDKLNSLNKSLSDANKILLDSSMKDIASFQRATMRLAIGYVQFEIDWYKTLADVIMNREEF